MEIGEGRQHTISGGLAHTDEITDILPESLVSKKCRFHKEIERVRPPLGCLQQRSRLV
jgi:hypothetical protein